MGAMTGNKGHLPADERRPLRDIEIEVVAYLANGLTYREAAREVHLSTPSVKRHVSNALRATGARNTAQLCVLAVRSGQLP